MEQQTKKKEKTVGRYVRLPESADKRLDVLRRKLSNERGVDLTSGDVVAEALALMEVKP